MECVKLTPLTPEEQTFAEENYAHLEHCIRVQRLGDELSDVAAFGYLHAVKKWFARPDLHRFAFQAVVYQTIRTHVSNERGKQKRRVQTVSLDAVIPGTDGLTYGHAVTASNMSYLYKEKNFMEIKFDVTIPAVARMGRSSSVEIETLVTFLGSVHKTVSLAYADRKTAASRASTLRGWAKKNNRTDFSVYRLGETIYIEKVMKTKSKIKYQEEL